MQIEVADWTRGEKNKREPVWERKRKARHLRYGQ